MNEELEKQIRSSLLRIVKKHEAVEAYMALLHYEVSEGSVTTTTFDWNGERLKITAPDKRALLDGVTHGFLRWGTETLLNGVEILTSAISQRILMIDMGRKFYSLKTLKRFVDWMSLFQFHYLQLHFSENLGFRIESVVCPEMVADEHLTKKEIRELIAYCQESQIEVIPDFDTPGHLEQLLNHYPEWRLVREDGQPESRALDITNPEAVAFVNELYREYGELFKASRYFHIGADEFVDFTAIHRYPSLLEAAQEQFGVEAREIDAYVSYVNQLADYIEQLGFIPRVWNDGFLRRSLAGTCQLTSRVEISYWTRWHKEMAPVEAFLEAGYTMINHNDNYFYYVLGEAASYTYPSYEKIMSDWQPDLYAQQQLADKKYRSQQLGLALSIWADIPAAKSEEEVLLDAYYLLAAMMQKVYTLSLGEKRLFEVFYQEYLTE